MQNLQWKDKIANHAQVGGIETSVIDNGSGRGVRIAWVNTGSGLRYKVVLDRAMDIAEAFYNQHSLAWLSNLGITPPNPAARELEWLKTFGGGLMVTCGLTHVGGPETDEYGERGLHGRISNIPAEVESIVQPDLSNTVDFSMTAKMKESGAFGPHLELRRTLAGKIGQPVIKIRDEIVNRGNTPAPHMMLYHFNFGWPLVDEGTDIVWKGKWQSRDTEMDRKIFREGNNFQKCPSPLEEHKGFGEAVAFIDITSDNFGVCICGLHNSQLGLAVFLQFKKEQLPWLTNWQHWGKGEYVTGLEPGTNPPIGQARARNQNELIHLEPGETRTYDLEMTVLDNEKKINDFLKKIS